MLGIALDCRGEQRLGGIEPARAQFLAAIDEFLEWQLEADFGDRPGIGKHVERGPLQRVGLVDVLRLQRNNSLCDVIGEGLGDLRITLRKRRFELHQGGPERLDLFDAADVGTNESVAHSSPDLGPQLCLRSRVHASERRERRRVTRDRKRIAVDHPGDALTQPVGHRPRQLRGALGEKRVELDDWLVERGDRERTIRAATTMPFRCRPASASRNCGWCSGYIDSNWRIGARSACTSSGSALAFAFMPSA